MKTNQIRNALLLLLTATIWGVAFVAQSVGNGYVGPFTFNAVRFFLGGIVLLPLLFWRNKTLYQKETQEEKKARWRMTLRGGICCGLVNIAHTNTKMAIIAKTDRPIAQNI